MSYCLNFEDLLGHPLRDIKTVITNSTKLNISDLRVTDLIYVDSLPIITGNGIYMFFKRNDCQYVGKSEKKSFVERIPAHFDIRDVAWFNTYLKKILVHKFANSLQEAFSYSLNTDLLLINIKDRTNLRNYCIKLEKLFRFLFMPIFNKLSDNLQGKMADRLDREENLLSILKSLA
jgi:hypothetical protein